MSQEQVQIESGAGVKLAGTLCLPDNTDSAPVVLLLAGSGRVDRDSNAMGFKLQIMSVLADKLAQAGIASLRYDKRGCGASTGNYYSAGHADLVQDASAAAQFLLANERVNTDRVFILGHSEGALIAPQVSAQVEQIYGLILICPTSQEFSDLLFAQSKHITEQINSMTGINAWIARLIFKVTGDPIQAQQRVLTKLGTDRADVIRVRGKKVNAKWLREMLLLDTKAIYRGIKCTTLVLGGGKDVQCDPSDVLEVRNLVSGPVASVVLPNMTHLLREDDQPASILRYKALVKLPVSPALIEHILGWLDKQQ